MFNSKTPIIPAPYAAPECETVSNTVETAVLITSADFGDAGSAGKDIEIGNEYNY